MLSKYQQSRSVRREMRTLFNRTRGGKLAPVMAVPFMGSESGSLSQAVMFKLDQIPGEMMTDIKAEIISVFVPLQAMDAMERDTAEFPGSDEALRALIMSGQPVFGMEDESELTKRLGVVGVANAGGTPQVSKAARLAHNCAVNFLRQRKYVHAATLDKNSTAITPALISQTVLDRFNAVLDPEDRVNGKVDLTGQIPVKGIRRPTLSNQGSPDAANLTAAGSSIDIRSNGNTFVQLDLKSDGTSGIYAELSGADHISLSDFYQAETMDRIVREMRKLVDDNPQFGEELVSRFAYGLDLDVGKQPFLLYQNTASFSNTLQRGMDGASLDVTASNLVARHEFTVPIPKTEFGGVAVTFICVKPDETIPSQPHPVFGRGWRPFNYAADELAIDPVPVTARDLDADVSAANEENIMCYTGNNEMFRTYLNYGLGRNLDPNTVANKTAIWQLDVPYSVTPENILYPDVMPHYPFEDQAADVCTYKVDSMAQINTPIIFGPTPVEELAFIESADVFEDAA